jgi:hypothetical protein
MAAVELEGVRIPVRVANLSAHGALVIGDGLPAAECEVSFKCHGVTIQSLVAWVRDRRAGIQFVDRIDHERLLRNAPLLHPAITKDTRKLDFRRPGFRGNQLSDDEKKVVEEWAGERRV